MKDLYQTEFRPDVQYDTILEFMRHWFKYLSGGAKGVVIGMSGGKDSTIAAHLWSKAIGKEPMLRRVVQWLMRCQPVHIVTLEV